MMKLLAVVVVCVAVANAHEVCRARESKILYAFSGTREIMKFPCKYNAVRRTVCGKWLVTISPGNNIDIARHKYVTRTLYVGVVNTEDKSTWEGRTTLIVARKYIDGLKEEPFNKKDGRLSASDVFRFESNERTVSLVEKKGQFRIDFNVYNVPTHQGPSGFSFECHANTFEPTPYPEQVCGNGTKREVAKYKREHRLRYDRRAVVIKNIFTNPNIIQIDSDCKSAANAMTRKCKGGEQQFQAARLCWPIVGKSQFYGKIIDSLQSPSSAFRHCVEFVCSGYKDSNACLALADELEACPTLPIISQVINLTCDKNFMSP